MHRCQKAAAIAALIVLSSPAAAKRVLVLTDPSATAAEDVLLGAAVRGSLDDEPGTTVVGPTPARAMQRALREADDAADILKGARQQFEALELEAALKESLRAVQKLDRFNALAGRMELHAAALGTLAASQLLLGQNKRAKTQLEALVAVRPDFTPDPSLYNPQMLETFKAICDEVKARKPKELRVVTMPSGAAVTVDGKLRGTAPLTLSLTPGKHYVSAALPGFEAAGQAVSSDRMEVTITLPRASQGAAQSAAAARAVAAGGDLPAEVFDLARKLKADEVVVLAKAAAGFVLARTPTDKSGIKVTRDPGPASSVDEAVGTAERLLQRPYAPVAGTPAGATGTGTATSGTGTTTAGAGSAEPASAGGVGAPSSATGVSTTASSSTSGTTSGGTDATTTGAAREPSPSSEASGSATASTRAGQSGGTTPAEAMTSLAVPAPAAETVDTGGGWPVWAYAGYGVALVAGGGAGLTGWLAYRQRHDFVNASTQLAGESLASKGKKYALYSDVLTGAAVVAAAGTLVLQLMAGPNATASADAQPMVRLAVDGFSIRF